MIRFLVLSLFFAFSSHAQSIPSSIQQSLMELKSSNQRILFVDVDNTMGYFNEFSGKWILYNGVEHFLIQHSPQYALVMLTANIQENIDKLFLQFPQLKPFFKMVITSAEFAPQFADLMKDAAPAHHKIEKLTALDSHRLLFEAWKKNPMHYLPKNILFEMPENAEEWREKIYLPYLLPNKAPLVEMFDGILIDDQFAGRKTSPSYESLAKKHRGVFAGPAGGVTPDSGPDFNQISKKIIDAVRILSAQGECNGDLEAH